MKKNAQHLGIFITCLGIIFASYGNVSLSLSVAESKKIGPYRVVFDGVEEKQNNFYQTTIFKGAVFNAANIKVRNIQAEIRAYPAQEKHVETGLMLNFFHHLHAVGYMTKTPCFVVSYKPFVSFIWLGGVWMVLFVLFRLSRGVLKTTFLVRLFTQSKKAT